MPVDRPGTLSITRVHTNADDDPTPVCITLRDGRKRVVKIRLSLADFAAALLGMSDVPCRFAAETKGDDLNVR